MKNLLRIYLFLATVFLGVMSGTFSQATIESSLIYYLNSAEFQSDRSNSVYGVEVHGGNVYIGDFRHNRIVVLDSSLKEKFKFDVSVDPHGIAVDKDGNIYVGGYNSPRILKFDSQGREIAGWDAMLTQQGLLGSVADLEFDPEGNLVVVADYGKGIMIRTDTKGNLKTKLSLSGLPNPETFYPHGIAIDVEGNIYAADRSKDIKVFSPDGTFKRAYSVTSGVAFDPLTVQFINSKIFFVPNYKDGKIDIFHVEQGFIVSVGEKGGAQGQFLSVTNLPIDEDGFGYVSEEDGNRIQKVDFKKVLTELQLQ